MTREEQLRFKEELKQELKAEILAETQQMIDVAIAKVVEELTAVMRQGFQMMADKFDAQERWLTNHEGRIGRLEHKVL